MREKIGEITMANELLEANVNADWNLRKRAAGGIGIQLCMPETG
jgi:hypothetical protein